MLLLTLAACLVDTDLYEERRADLADQDGDGYVAEQDCNDRDPAIHPGAPETCDDLGIDEDCDGQSNESGAVGELEWFLDADGDGYGTEDSTATACDPPANHVSSAGDCDDDDASTHPGASDTWYDGVDSDCAGNDDDDADGDGDPSADHSGADCDDTDPSRSSETQEGWLDLSVDNDCDGQVDDPVELGMDEATAWVAGPAADAQLGWQVLTVPDDWWGGEEAVLLAAPFQDDFSGAVYAFESAALDSELGLASSTWTAPGGSGSLTGLGLALAGTPGGPVTLIGEAGFDESRGRVLGWTGSLRDADPAAPDFTIEGVHGGALFGGRLASDHDQDGDGVADLIISAQLDSSRAVNAGAVYVFLLDGPTPSAVTADDADQAWTTEATGAQLRARSIGDADGDGLDDLAFTQNLPGQVEVPGGAVVWSERGPGVFDVVEAADLTLHGGPFVFGAVEDTDADGRGELFAASGSLYRFELPLSGAVSPWDDAVAKAHFADDGDSVTSILTHLPYYDDHGWVLAACAACDGQRGRAFLQRARWEGDEPLEETQLGLAGDQAGDMAASAVTRVDGSPLGPGALLVGAPGSDGSGTESGAVYLVPGPE